MTRPQETFYEQRRMRQSNDEGKRRKLIRWITKAMGVADDDRALHNNTTNNNNNYINNIHALDYVERERPYEPAAVIHVPVPVLQERLSLNGSAHGSSNSHSTSAKDVYPPRKDSHTNSNHSGSAAYDHEPDVPVYYMGSKPQPQLLASQATTTASSFRSTANSSLSTASTLSLSSTDASIYEYHHQMPRTRQPQPEIFPRYANTPHVLIIGGGIGGLCLAQGLKKNGIPFTIFERDPTPNYRTQGYRLRINSSGYEALKANLSRDNFEVFLRSTGHFLPGFQYVDAMSGGAAPAGVKFAHRSSVTQHVFSTDRAMLRSLLLTDLVEGREIQFDMAFKKYQILPNGRVEVMFENGKVVEGSVLVGADGTTSRVRRQYIPRHITLLDTDSGAIYGKTPITPDIEQYFATGSTTMVTSEEPKMALVIEPRCATKVNLDDYISATGGMQNAANSDLPDLHNYLCWVLFARADQFHTRPNMTVHDLYAMAPEEVAELSTQITSNWCPRIRALFEKQDPEWASFLRISSMSPDIKTWQPTVVTLLGDAVHTMTPAGIGSNTAMQDARILVKLFKEHGVNVDAIARYERAMREHGREGITISMEASTRMFGLPHPMDMRAVMY